MAWKTARKGWLLGSIAVFAIACNSSGGLHSGVAGNKALKDLSKKEIQKICDAANQNIAAALPTDLVAKAACAQQALATGNITACEIAMQLCLDRLADGGTAQDIGVSAALMPQLGSLQCFTTTELDTCKATVAELEGCLQNTFASQSRALHGASCAALNGERVPLIESQSTNGCEALDKKCPGLSNFTRRTEIPGTNPIPGPGNPMQPGSSDCADLKPAYDGSDCNVSGCTRNTQCPCGTFPMSYNICNSVLGCLSSVDCDVACNFIGSVYSCAQQNTCKSDSDCGDYYCVISVRGGSGTCSRGKPGDSCADDGDCKTAHCDSTLGSMRCKGATATGGTCTTDLDCTSGICALQPSLGTQQCSDGANGDPCSDATDCKSQACVYASSGYKCSDRSTGSPCSSDSDCVSTRCAQGGRTSSICVTGMPGDACDSSSDCTSGRCVTSQVSSQSSCAYDPGATCPQGRADCNGECRVMQATCSSADCSPTCSGGSCSSATLATLSATDKSTSVTLSNGNLAASASGSQVGVRATLGKNTGRWYWEVSADSTSSSGFSAVGVLTMTASLDFGLGNSVATGAGYTASGTLSTSSGTSTSACSFSSGSVIGVALDLAASVIYFSVDGVWQGGADPASGTGGLALGTGNGDFYPAVSLGVGDVLSVNFGQSSFAHAPPDGFEAVAQ